MPDREVLADRTAPGLVLVALGLALAGLSLMGDRDVSGALAGLLWLGTGAWWFATRHTVLDAGGIRPAGQLRRIAWDEVVDVRRSRSALHYAEVELEVSGSDRLVHLGERPGGRDLAAVRSRWLAATGRADAPGPEQGRVDLPGSAGP